MKQSNLFDPAPFSPERDRFRPLYNGRRRLLPPIEAALLDLKRTVDAESAKRRLSGRPSRKG